MYQNLVLTVPREWHHLKPIDILLTEPVSKNLTSPLQYTTGLSVALCSSTQRYHRHPFEDRDSSDEDYYNGLKVLGRDNKVQTKMLRPSCDARYRLNCVINFLLNKIPRNQLNYFQ